MNVVRTSRAALVAAFLLLTPQVHAQRLAYESFDYGAVAGTPLPLGGQDGGAGWASPWIGAALPPGLLHYWPLDFSTWDAGPDQAHGTASVKTTFVNPQSGAPSPLFWSGGAVAMNGQSGTANLSFIDLSAHAALFQRITRGTISVWIRTTATANMAIFTVSDRDVQANDFALRLQNGKVAISSRGELGPNFSQQNLGPVLSDGAWHHIAVTCDATGQLQVYTDGTLVHVVTCGFLGHVIGLDQVAIGRAVINNSASQYFNGQIDDLAIFGSALSATEIARLAAGNTIPLLETFVPNPTGPNLDADSFGSAAIPHASYSAQGFTSFGNRIADNSGFRLGRLLATPIDMSANATYYMSCLLRRSGAGVSPVEIQFTDVSSMKAHFGWDASATFVAGLTTPKTGNPASASQVFFAVFRITTSQGGNDQAHLKVYPSTRSVHASDASISGQGTNPNEWTAISDPEAVTGQATQIWLVQKGTDSIVGLDEIRIGTTWESVTRYDYGTGCLGATIGQTNRPAIGSSNFSLDIGGGNPNVGAWVLFGALPQSIDLTGVGAPSCFLLNTAEFAVAGSTNASGTFSLNLPIPNDPTILGQSLYTQGLLFDTTNKLPLAFSPGIQLQIER